MFRDLIGVGDNKPAVISFVGAGGKTTILFTLSQELAHKKRLITTTTAIYQPAPSLWDIMVIRPNLLNGLDNKNVKPDTVTVWGGSLSPENKLLGVSTECLTKVVQTELFDTILIEADGSKRRPIKAPAEHEPVIPVESTTVVGVIGLNALNKPINNQWVHRVEAFRHVVQANTGEPIQPEHLVRLIKDPNGLFKGTPSGVERILVLNQADHECKKIQGSRIIEKLKQANTGIEKFVLTSFNPATFKLIWGEQL